jgi:hypothetical protein
MEPVNYTTTAARAFQRGSALILAVVLTSLLAIIGVLFVLTARIDKMATSATVDNRELTLAVDTVLAEINELLVQDVPGVGKDPKLGYYDYPDVNNPWLAEIEPYQPDTGGYYWRQVSTIAGPPKASDRNVHIRVVGEREPISDANATETNADADGDGVGDAKWFAVPGVMSSKGKPIYAAVRIVDNGGMLNVNTGYRFDPTDSDPNNVNGSSQLQVNVAALAGASGASTLRTARAVNAGAAIDLPGYEQQVIWTYPEQMRDPNWIYSSPFTPFDLSDELELRYRWLLNRQDVDTRLETWGSFRQSALSTPVNSATDLGAWFLRVTSMGGVDSSYAYRTIATTYNADRIITPKPLAGDTGTKVGKMVNVNRANEAEIRAAVTAALSEVDPTNVGLNSIVLQITANLLDYIDDDDEVTVLSGGSSQYYGFERPCIYLSEIAYRVVKDPTTSQLHSSYAIELYKPYFEDRDPRPGEWKVVIDNPSTPDAELEIAWSGSRRFHVLLAEDAVASLANDVSFADAEEPTDTMPLYGYNRSAYGKAAQGLGSATIEAGATILLKRKVPSAAGWITVDFKRVPDAWNTPDGTARSFQRDISTYKCIRRLWSPDVSIPALGNATGNYVDTKHSELIQAHPANKPLTNIGELGLILARSAYSIQETDAAKDCLIDLRNPFYRKLFNYLTVIDPWNPAKHPAVRSADETRIQGRININTAPAFVLAQLPWMMYQNLGPFQKATAIVAVRDSAGPYKSIGDLLQVGPLWMLDSDKKDNQHTDTPRGPDLTPDTARDDLEERDLIFTRISNLITVRSDVFTAYIVTRLGTNGPQKRVMAILDRSQVNAASDRVRIVALYPVPDPR